MAWLGGSELQAARNAYSDRRRRPRSAGRGHLRLPQRLPTFSLTLFCFTSAFSGRGSAPGYGSALAATVDRPDSI